MRGVPYKFIVPAIIFIFTLMVYPFIYNIYLSFTDMRLIYPTYNFTGIENFERLFTSSDMAQIMLNTFIFVLGSISLQVIVGLLLALLVNEKFPGRTFVRAAVLVTWVIPEITVAFIWRLMLIGDNYGILNYLLVSARVVETPISWLSTKGITMPTMIMVNNWRGTAFSMVLLLAALQAVPNQLHEAAKVDGANSWQRFWNITLPLIIPTILILMIMITIFTFNVATLPLALTGGGPGRATELIALTMYRKAFVDFDMGFGSAIGVAMLLINIVFVFLYIKIFPQEQLRT